MDLHGWITQQVDLRAAEARGAADGAGDTHWQAAEEANCECCVHLRTKSGGLLCTPDSRYADHMAAHDPAAVLRRCEADRRILDRHDTDPDSASDRLFATACHGCGTFGDCDDPVTENINDCPELLDLAHAHGLTDDILAGLDRPKAPEEPKREANPDGLMGMLRDAFDRALTPPVTTSDVPAALRGPHWKP